jgi:hypothetical protein
MPSVAVNIIRCIALGFCAYIIDTALYFPWANTFVTGTWHVYLELITIGQLLDWLFPFTLFALAGIATAALVRSTRPDLWALGLGIAYSLFDLSVQFTGAGPSDLVSSHMDYVRHLIPIPGAWLGARFLMLIRKHRRIGV